MNKYNEYYMHKCFSFKSHYKYEIRVAETIHNVVLTALQKNPILWNKH